MPLSSGSKLGPYEILALLGVGGMGEVYLARDPRLDREVAIKVLPAERLGDEERRKRFVREARAASRLSHPNVVTIHEIESADDVDFIVMEYVRGRSLDRIIPRSGMRLEDLLRIAIPMADALASAHAAGIVHRDLKPTNVMVSEGGAVKVLDFGLAKLLTSLPASSTAATHSVDPLSQPGMVAGTVGYMSPEQAAGKEVDARSDVFSLGAVLYEMATGRRAFAGDSAAEVQASLLKDSPRPPRDVAPDLPKELERLILRCLRKHPGRRFQHVADLKIDLEEVKEASELGPMVPVPQARRRRWPWVVAGGAAALAAIAVGYWSWRAWQPRAPIPQALLVPLTSTPGMETEPTFSPDGTQVAFAWQGERQDNWDIYVKMVESTETRRLTTDAGQDRFPSWSPDGRQIAFVRAPREGASGAIYLVSPLGGAVRRLGQTSAVGRLSWSPDGRWLATGSAPFEMTAKPDERGVRLIATSEGTAHTITSPGLSIYHVDPVFSPIGHRLAYGSCINTLACQVDVVELDVDSAPKAEARRLTTSVFWMGGLAFARDGESVIYDSRIDGRLWRVGLAGDQPPERIDAAGYGALWPTAAASRDRLAFVRQLTNQDIYKFEVGRSPTVVAASSFPDYGAHFSPDGRRFAFESGRAGEGDEIWIAASDGSDPTRLTHGPGVWQGGPKWSPDGRSIAFDSEDRDGRWSVWTIQVDGGSMRRITSAPDSNHPSWSRDGRFIYFDSNRAGLSDVWRVPVVGGPEERVSHGGGVRPYESADGRTVLFKRTGSQSSLWAMPVGGGPERQVAECLPAGDTFAVGQAGIYYTACVNRGASPLYLLDPITGQDRLLGNLEGFDGGLTVSPDGKAILYTRLVGEGGDLMLIENFR